MLASARSVPYGTRRLGVILVLSAGFCLSSAGLILRSIDQAGVWQILFYRSIGFTLTVFAYLFWTHRFAVMAPFLAIGWRGVVVALALGAGFICYVFAMLLTTVANVSFVLSSSPFFAAVLGWLCLRERVPVVTWLAIVVALSGLSIMLIGDLALGNYLGNLIALVAVVAFAIMIVAMRSAGATDMMPATCLAGVGAMIVAAAMIESFHISFYDLSLSLLLGSAQVGAGFILLTRGTRYLPAAEVALLTLTETILGPIWVWLLIGEVPTRLALTGGAIMLFAVVGQALYRLRKSAPVTLPLPADRLP